MIARTAKDIDVLTDSFPSEDSYAQPQVAALSRLEAGNLETARPREDTVAIGKYCSISTLSDIAHSQLKA